MNNKRALTASVNGPVVKATGMSGFKVREMLMVGEKKTAGRNYFAGGGSRNDPGL